MLRDFIKLTDCVIEGKDGIIGTVADLYFDDQTGKIHYLAANTGNWLEGRHVLIAQESLLDPKWEISSFPAVVNKAEVERAPTFEINQPLVWQKEREICTHYRWNTYFPISERELAIFRGTLASANGLKDFSLQALDGELGKIVNYIIDDRTWIVRYLVVDTAKWLTGRKVLLSLAWIQSIDWPNQLVVVDLTQAQIENAPEYDPTIPIERMYEIELYKHYDKAPYW
jgi:uncharacterized protein YrrD